MYITKKQYSKLFFTCLYITLSPGDVCLFTLGLLPVLLQTPLKSKGPYRWKPSKIELEDGFILHVDVSFSIPINIQFDWVLRKYTGGE